MTLDLTALSTQVRQMGQDFSHRVGQMQAWIEQVRQTYLDNTGRETDLVNLVNLSSNANPWRTLACPTTEPFDTIHDVPPAPTDYALIATDGSQIEVDRHSIALYYLINIGKVYLRYGATPAAHLLSEPALYYRDEDLYLTQGTRRVPIEGNALSAHRDVQELVMLDKMSEQLLDHDIPVIALQDGTLIRWTLAGTDKLVQEKFLHPYLDSLERLRERRIPVASYISQPRATELIGLIRLMYCQDVDSEQERGAMCNQCSDVAAGSMPSCNLCDSVRDADIFFGRLREGQRGPLFISMNQVNTSRYGDHRIHFFYMRVGREMARIELPEWIASDPQQVDLVHALIYDQCARGHGYPVGLARAHEKAVVRTADRRTVRRMIEESLIRADVVAASSLKQENKEFVRV